MRYLLLLLMFVSSVVRATEVITSDVGSWSSTYGFQPCYGYSGARPCVSDGTYFANEGIGSGDVVFAYQSYTIYNTFTMPATFSGSTMYLSLDLMTGPRNSEQGNKTEYVIITIYQYNASGAVVASTTINENIVNTTMQTFDYTITKASDTTSVFIQISGRDGGYWAGNYGAVIGAGSITLNDGAGAGPVTSTTTGTSLGPTSTQSTSKSSAQSRRDSYSGDDNGIYVDQVGSNNTISILQASSNNQLRGINQDRAKMWGNYNNIDIRQGAQTSTGINLIEFMMDGDSNTIKLYQDRGDTGTEDASAYGDHIIRANVDGNSNNIQIIQRNNTTYAEGHYVELDVIGNSNTINFKQISDYGKDIFASITGNSNSLTVLQNDNSRHFADITLTGDGHSVNLTQSGTGAHRATIDLTYGTAPSTLNLNQLGNTNQSYSFEQTCYDAGGCSATLTQQ